MKKQNAKYALGIAWFILSLFISNLNDILMKHLGSNLHPTQVAFMRFLFGTLSLLPFMLYGGLASFQTSRISIHIVRGLLLFLGISVWCFGLGIVPILSATLLTFTIPFFVLIMAPIFLGEKVKKSLWVATFLGFLGVYFVLNPHAEDFNVFSIVMLISALLFATLDIINKKFVSKESMLSMLFYSALFTTILGALPAYYYWRSMSDIQILLLAVLGAFGNLILYCILKAFAYVRASDVSPYRYLELVVSAFTGFVLFNEAPTMHTIVGAIIIIPSTFYIGYMRMQEKG